MLGAIIGDIVGSVYEFDNHRSKEFELFSGGNFFTDDSVLTCATMNALLTNRNYSEHYRKFTLEYPDRGYGVNFIQWVKSGSFVPYGSYGNGSAMRVSPIAWFEKTLDKVLAEARKSASVTHNHPEGIEGAQATAAAIFLARNKASIYEIKKHLEANTSYRFRYPVQHFQEQNHFDESCKGTVPVAMTCFFESNSFEDCIRNAVSVGGDTDTICAIAGSVAEAYFEIPNEIKDAALRVLDPKLASLLNRFYSIIKTENQ